MFSIFFFETSIRNNISEDEDEDDDDEERKKTKSVKIIRKRHFEKKN